MKNTTNLEPVADESAATIRQCHTLIIGSCETMPEISDESVQLMITSPPYFNAPFDYAEYYSSYKDYLSILRQFAMETYRVLTDGRIAVVNIDDMLVNGEKYPIVADITKIFQDVGFRYRDKIIWKKPDGYLRISRRSGVFLQHPYPMYFYPDNLLESILIFQKGKFDYKSKSMLEKKASTVDKLEFQQNGWYKTLWEMTNVLPNSKLEKNVAAFPYELPYRLIKLFSFKNEVVLDPFAGSGTTMKAAMDLDRNSIGIEIENALSDVISRKLGFTDDESNMFDGYHNFSILRRHAST